MTRQGSNFVLALGAFLGGYCAALLLASRPGRETREQIATRVRSGGDWVESQVKEANFKIRATGEEVAGKIRSAAQDVANQILPDLATDSEDWDTAYAEAVREVQRRK